MKQYVAILLAFGSMLAGCAAHFQDVPLAQGHVNEERRIHSVARPDQPVILVAISGGGSRAAALGWAVLEKLKRTSYTVGGQTMRLIDDIAVVSSVSGGSVIAGYFGLNGPDGLDGFDRAFLRPDNMRALELHALNPFTWVRLKSTGNSRIKLLQELLDREIYAGKTFDALNQPGKPLVVLNSTDMASGEVFSFLPSRFDDICADFDAEPLSTGVSASAAFPILLTPVALRNYGGADCNSGPMPPWITAVLDKQFTRYVNLEEFNRARYAYDLRRGPGASRQIDYLYLLDGGLADNLGVNALMDVIDSAHGAAIISGSKGGIETILNAVNVGDITRLAVVVVNARTEPPNPVSVKDSRPGIIGMIDSTTSVPIDSSTSRGMDQVDTLLSELQAAPQGDSAGLRVYKIQVDFDLFRAQNATEKALSDAVKKIPTSFSISGDQVGVLERSAEVLLNDSPCFQRLLLDAGVVESDGMAQYAVKGCPQLADRPAIRPASTDGAVAPARAAATAR
jgi:NTE family protein